jgi:hypothetical protein
LRRAILLPFRTSTYSTAIYLMLGVGILKGATVTTHITGTFDVKLSPQATDDKAEGAALGRMSIDKA